MPRQATSTRVVALLNDDETPRWYKLAVVAQASGVQIYQCNASKADSGRYEWTFRAPEARLADDAGRVIGRHYAGPTWESNDGSRVVGAVQASDAGPDSNAIAWLLLRATSSAGNGIMAKTQSVQRLNTVGGKAPPGGCDGAQVGKEARVPYRATYYFYVARS